MLPVIQIVNKNELIKRKASVFLEDVFNRYSIDSRTIIYSDLRPLFKDAPGFIIKKFELDKKLSEEDLSKFKKLCGTAKPKATTSSHQPKTAVKNFNKVKGTGKTK